MHNGEATLATKGAWGSRWDGVCTRPDKCLGTVTVPAPRVRRENQPQRSSTRLMGVTSQRVCALSSWDPSHPSPQELCGPLWPDCRPSAEEVQVGQSQQRQVRYDDGLARKAGRKAHKAGFELRKYSARASPGSGARSTPLGGPRIR